MIDDNFPKSEGTDEESKDCQNPASIETSSFSFAAPRSGNFEVRLGGGARFIDGRCAALALLLLTVMFGFTGLATAAPTFSYAVTTVSDPVKPGQVARFTVTVTNLSTAVQSTTLHFTVPKFTQYGGLTAGASTYFNLLSVPAGGSQSAFVDLTVLSGSQTIHLCGPDSAQWQPGAA
jgi:hypothetical protein